MTVSDYITLIASLTALLTGLFAIWKAVKSTPHDIASTDSGTAAKYQEIADRAAERALKLQEKIEQLETEHKALKRELEERDRLIAEWQLGIERLIGQIVSLGQKPVWQPDIDLEIERSKEKTRPRKPNIEQ